VLSRPGVVDEVAALFEKLVVAVDAAYGCAATDTGTMRPNPLLGVSLPGVFWLNYFGPAFLATRPELSAAGGARMLATGGVLVRTTEQPGQAVGYGVPAWQEELRAILGTHAFRRHDPNPFLPTIEDHVAASPGTMEMPWDAWEAQEAVRDREKAVKDQERKHASAQRRLAAAVAGREAPVLPGEVVEWSTSFDLPDWQRFAEYLTRKLRGDLSTTIGRATLAVIETAPVDEEDEVLLDTELGAIRLHWFIDDYETVDIYVFGSSQVHDLCDRWLH
jgi:hypothetical protein